MSTEKNGTPSVQVSDTTICLPTYRPAPADPNPMFLEKRVYQGSSGRVYPLPFVDRIAEEPEPHDWRLLKLENKWLEVWILPEIGGRVHRLFDKVNGYDAIYYQPVIKPALVGLAGPWISGGIEFNWPQHHRPTTFMPVEVHVERSDDGSVTVWLSEHEPVSRMKGMHGICLRPDRAVLDVCVRVHNRTDDVQTFLWWANAATEVHERYQSFFPPDATFVADHAKRAMSTFPLCSGTYYGVDYGKRARSGVPVAERPRQFQPDGSYTPDDLSWYTNIPVPTSYMCMGTRKGFFGGYDHRARAGLVHVANPHISPGKKQWTWGNHEFGYAWDRQLTDPDERGLHRPYIELMAGVYTDNQPDFSFLQPGETKTWTQHYYPIRDIGPCVEANADIAASFRREGDKAKLGLHATREIPGARVSLRCGDKDIATLQEDLHPDSPLRSEWTLPTDVSDAPVFVTVHSAEGDVLLSFVDRAASAPPDAHALEAMAATEPKQPEEIKSADELFHIGLHLEQYRHATRCPTAWWNEALRRDPGDSRCNLAMGRWHLRRGEFEEAATFLRKSIERQTSLNPNPSDGEALFQLGRALAFQDRFDDAYAALYKATWNQGWASAAFLALARMDCRRSDWSQALLHLESCLRLDTDSLRARGLKILVLRRMKRDDAACQLLASSRSLDPLDGLLRYLAGESAIGDNGVRLDLAFDLEHAGMLRDALCILDDHDPQATDGTVPMVHYTRAWLFDRLGETEAAAKARQEARATPTTYCFPSRLEEMRVLQAALASDARDPGANLLLGYFLYDRRRHREAIQHWEACVASAPENALAWRCLGIARFNVLREPNEARDAYARARRAAPDDARLLYEADQLDKRLGYAPELRLKTLQAHPDLVRQRDDLTIELCALYNHLNQPERAAALLDQRRFQPWEGGEGLVLAQYVRSRILLGRKALRNGSASEAAAFFQSALHVPENLGETKHLLANQSDVFFWLGTALDAAGAPERARNAWRTAAGLKGDFQQMSVRAFSEMTFFSALARRRLGDSACANELLNNLLHDAQDLERQKATIDYFATSLPAMLLFEDDIQQRQTVTARLLQALACLGLGRQKGAARLFADVLRMDPNHSLAADLRDMKDVLDDHSSNPSNG